MAFDKTAARGSSRTRSAVSKARLEMPLLLPPPFGGFLESAHPATPLHQAGARSLGRVVVSPPGRRLCACRFGVAEGRHALGGFYVLEMPSPRKEGGSPEVSAPCLRLCPELRPERLARRTRSEAPLRACLDCRRSSARCSHPRPGDIEVSPAVAAALSDSGRAL